MYVSVQTIGVEEAELDMVVVLIREDVEVRDSETQRTCPMERSQLASNVGLNAYS